MEIFSKKIILKLIQSNLNLILIEKDCKFSISTLDSNLTFKGINYDRAIQLEGTSVVVIPLIFYRNKLKLFWYLNSEHHYAPPVMSFHLDLQSTKFKRNLLKQKHWKKLG